VCQDRLCCRQLSLHFLSDWKIPTSADSRIVIFNSLVIIFIHRAFPLHFILVLLHSPSFSYLLFIFFFFFIISCFHSSFPSFFFLLFFFLFLFFIIFLFFHLSWFPFHFPPPFSYVISLLLPFPPLAFSFFLLHHFLLLPFSSSLSSSFPSYCSSSFLSFLHHFLLLPFPSLLHPHHSLSSLERFI
jgi:hypothetical protein